MSEYKRKSYEVYLINRPTQLTVEEGLPIVTNDPLNPRAIELGVTSEIIDQLAKPKNPEALEDALKVLQGLVRMKR
jgi:hypothetical protein